MSSVRWMIAASVGSSLVVTLLLGERAGIEIVLGMFGPLFVASGSWVLAERVWHRQPERLTAVMITAFAGKVIFFAAYVAFMLSVLSLRPVPFVASFTTYFIALHAAEAMLLRRLFSHPPSRQLVQ
jgi:hypothetical protein